MFHAKTKNLYFPFFFTYTSKMEVNEQLIESLKINEDDLCERVAKELAVKPAQVKAVISLIKEGATVPFIARYRKEMHGNLDELEVRNADHLFKTFENLEERRLSIVKAVFKTGKLNESLYKSIMLSKSLSELEDLYAPFKKKKKTRGMSALEKGLEGLSEALLVMNGADLLSEAKKYVKENPENPELSVKNEEEALKGAIDIIAEKVYQDTALREKMHKFYSENAKIKTKGIVNEGESAEEAEAKSNYKMYWSYERRLNEVKEHNILAINRGEREGKLEVTLEVDTEEALTLLKSGMTFHNKYHEEAVKDALTRLLSPALIREIRSDKTQEADRHGINIFSENLKNLLMTKPIKGSRVLGIDPGIRTGTKCAALDETGKYLASFLIRQVASPDAAYNLLKDAIKKYKIEIVAVGNGTGSHEVQAIVAKVLKENFSEVKFTVVDESGASVYSASDIAREEFPDLDLTIRGAISMGRRLQDPLSEFVKIDPKAIGVGLYQHDVNQKKLSEELKDVVSSVVNSVGVNLNTASYSLLKYVSGISKALAKKIVGYRDEHGKITSREELKKIPGLGEKTYEQCAGFLKIPESEEMLDNTWVHPENYAIAREILKLSQASSLSEADKNALASKYNVGLFTLSDISEELKKPSRDPREECPEPIMQQGVLEFENLKEGQKVKGKVQNVVDFGAFVDLGLHERGLLHLSEMSDSFVKDPMDVVKVGDVMEFTVIELDKERRRISLSLKSDASNRKEKSKKTPRNTEGKVKILREKNKDFANKAKKGERRSSSHDSDGMTYNPFKLLLKK